MMAATAMEPAFRLEEPQQSLTEQALLAASHLATTQTATRFRALIRRAQGARLGLELDLSEGATAFIVQVGPGVVADYNSRNNGPSGTVEPGDVIMGVNGCSGNVDEMIQHLQSDEELALDMLRPQYVKVSIPEGDTCLGLDVLFAPRGVTLLVDKIAPGMVENFNRSNKESGIDSEVRVKDRIVSVNGIVVGKEGPSSLLEVLHQPGGKELLLLRVD